MRDLVLLGAGGHARSVLAALTSSGRVVRGYFAPWPSDGLPDLAYLGEDDAIGDWNPGEVDVVNAVGSIGSTALRRRLHELAVRRGFTVEGFVHPAAHVDPGASLGAGVQVFAGAIINVGARVGTGTLINTGAIIEHDTTIGEHVHIAPGAVLAGDVRVGADAFVGLGSRIIQGRTVGSGSIVGAGAVVLADVDAAATVVGVPARPRSDRSEDS
ncbi:MAG: acetyltransferase [Candidatus Microbacterium colombiense]|nr:MAG: acetyltransferase [Microbacterium sp.]